MKMSLLLALLQSYSAWCASEDETTYFNLHQATGFYEQYVTNRCPVGKDIALSLLREIDQRNIRIEIKMKVLQLNSMIRNLARFPKWHAAVIGQIPALPSSTHRLISNG